MTDTAPIDRHEFENFRLTLVHILALTRITRAGFGLYAAPPPVIHRVSREAFASLRDTNARVVLTPPAADSLLCSCID